jgi:PKD repeat protein
VAQLTTTTPATGAMPLSVSFDAGGSHDSDGSITGYEWDFDGDGGFDASTAAAATQHTYAAAGVFTARVRVTDNEGATATATAVITVTNATPLPALAATPSSGNAPLSVAFSAAGSADPDGTLVDYEWDLDGDGAYNEAGAEQAARGLTAPAAYVYTAGGTVTASVRVTDNGGLQAVATAPVTVNTNPAPVAALTADHTAGPAPLTVNLSAAASTDDGQIVKYEWDDEGDGTYDSETGTTATHAFTYNTPGVYHPAVRVTDNGGATGSKSITVTVAVNQLPSVTLAANPLSGPAPLTVDFTASGNDADGTIVSYEWDFGGDGAFEENTGTTPTVQFQYPGTGTYPAAVRVTDNSGGEATDSVTIVVAGIAGNQSPTADIQPSLTSGVGPLNVTFNAGGSSDPDGSIVLYEWDWENDGTFDLQTQMSNPGLTPSACG